ncbi:hypothetical protein D8674_005359 [Pyrus ussuriensis x Pyrus communis]|uniref:Uncharacterized protein n=1 Tax=Pyrus ussuriensis x Pyrus communis TaxID=2448454 RepID=A0A5N5FWW8_9ROSA|nr:hypothetical protein D8674_005359 [Pyrus ussuriensis x Pyrus communis]
MKKSDWDVIHIVNWYDTKKRMFKFKNGYCKVNADDRLNNPKENRFVDKYFADMTRIGRREIAQVIQVAFDAGTTEGDQDAACLIILYLLNTNLLGSSMGKLSWSLAKETARYLMESIDRTHKRKRDKQSTVSGNVVLLLVSKQKLIKRNQFLKGEKLTNNSEVRFGKST